MPFEINDMHGIACPLQTSILGATGSKGDQRG